MRTVDREHSPGNPQGPLCGIRVLDFGKYVTGPYAANILADLGADVIRIERPGGADDRFIIPITGAEGNVGGCYLNNNRNKRSLALDLTKPEGQAILSKLVHTADVVVANMPPPALAALKLDYESLSAAKPDIILALATAYGLDGPYSDRPGFDTVGQCMSGAVDLTGFPDAPVRSQAAYCDFGTSLYLVIGIFAALMDRAKTGLGQQVDASLLHTGLAFVGQYLTEQALEKRNRRRTGNRGVTSAPIDIFTTVDGRVLIFVIGNSQFKRIAKLVGHAEWIEDPRFADDDLRGLNGQIISDAIGGWCADMTNDELLETLQAAGIPAAPMLSLEQALHDEHIVASQFLQRFAFPGVNQPVPVVDLPVRFSRTVAGIRTRPPLLGEQSASILEEIGLLAPEIDDLARQGIIQRHDSDSPTASHRPATSGAG